MSEFDNLNFPLGCADSSDVVHRGPFAVAILDYTEDASRRDIGLTPDLVERYGSIVLNIDTGEEFNTLAAHVRLKKLGESLMPFFEYVHQAHNNEGAHFYGYGGNIKGAIGELVKREVVDTPAGQEMTAYVDVAPSRPYWNTQNGQRKSEPRPEGATA